MFEIEKIRLLLFTMVLITGCSGSDDGTYKSKVTLLLLKECETSAINFLDSITEGGISYEIEKFDVVIDSHPSAVGLLDVRSVFEAKEGLMSIINRIKLDCYPMASGEFPRNLKNEDMSEAAKLLHLNRRTGIKNNYVVIGDEKIFVYFKE